MCEVMKLNYVAEGRMHVWVLGESRGDLIADPCGSYPTSGAKVKTRSTDREGDG